MILEHIAALFCCVVPIAFSGLVLLYNTLFRDFVWDMIAELIFKVSGTIDAPKPITWDKVLKIVGTGIMLVAGLILLHVIGGGEIRIGI